jgi:hypothetical protein
MLVTTTGALIVLHRSLPPLLIYALSQVLGFITTVRFADYQFNSEFNPTIFASFAMSVLTNCTLTALTGACHTTPYSMTSSLHVPRTKFDWLIFLVSWANVVGRARGPQGEQFAGHEEL